MVYSRFQSPSNGEKIETNKQTKNTCFFVQAHKKSLSYFLYAKKTHTLILNCKMEVYLLCGIVDTGA